MKKCTNGGEKSEGWRFAVRIVELVLAAAILAVLLELMLIRTHQPPPAPEIYYFERERSAPAGADSPSQPGDPRPAMAPPAHARAPGRPRQPQGRPQRPPQFQHPPTAAAPAPPSPPPLFRFFFLRQEIHNFLFSSDSDTNGPATDTNVVAEVEAPTEEMVDEKAPVQVTVLATNSEPDSAMLEQEKAGPANTASMADGTGESGQSEDAKNPEAGSEIADPDSPSTFRLALP